MPRTAIAGARTASVGDTTYRVDDGGTGVLRVEDGHDLDQYLSASSSPLDFAITTRPLLESLPEGDRDEPWGPTDADGRPVEGNTFFDRQGRLTLRVWDVDDDYAGTDVAPEIDEVVFNGELLPGALSGADGQWSVNTFEVPLRLLQLPTDEDPDGRNEIAIRIDTGNGGIDDWAVEVAWAELRLDSSAPPTALAHGFQETAAVMQPIEDHLVGQVDDLDDGSVARLEHDAEGTIEDNADTIAEEVTDLLTATGSATLNMVSHSKGGLDSRLFAWDNPGLVNHLVMLGTPNGGSELADDWCDSVNGLGLRAAISTWFGPDQGECDGHGQGMTEWSEAGTDGLPRGGPVTGEPSCRTDGSGPPPLAIIEVEDHLVAPLARVWVRAIAALDGRSPPDAVPARVVDEFRQLLVDDERSWALLAYAGTTPVGCVRATDARANGGTGDPVPGLAHLASLAVEPARWGTGIGSALLREVERTAASRGYGTIQLVVDATNVHARSLYRSAGWRETRDTVQVDGRSLVRYVRALPARP